jgi:hypothetical protein
MTAHSLSHKEWSRPAHRRLRNGLLQLGWPQFWLLIGILSGMLGLVALVFIAYLQVAR